MEEKEWALDELKRLFEQSQDYKQKALLQAAGTLLEEQETRKEQLQGQLDGTLWSPGNWSG